METPGSGAQDPQLAAHERTYEAFNIFLRWCMVALASSLLMLTLWFATAAGFLAALITGIVVFAVGYQLLVRGGARKPPEVASPDH